MHSFGIETETNVKRIWGGGEDNREKKKKSEGRFVTMIVGISKRLNPSANTQ